MGGSSASLSDVVVGMFISNQDLATMSSGALWFLPVLFFVSVVFYGIVELDRKGKIKLEASLLICFALVVYLSMFYGKDAVLHWATVPMAVIFYFLGWVFIQYYRRIIDVIIGKNKNRDSFEPLIRFTVVAIALFAVGIWAGVSNGKISMHNNHYNTIALTFVSSIGISAALAMLMMRLPKIKLLDYAGKNSIIFFGFHIAFLRLFEALDVTEGFASTHALATAIIIFLLMVPVSMFVNRFCPFIVMKKRKSKTE